MLPSIFILHDFPQTEILPFYNWRKPILLFLALNIFDKNGSLVSKAGRESLINGHFPGL